MNEAGVPKSSIYMTNSRGIIWQARARAPTLTRRAPTRTRRASARTRRAPTLTRRASARTRRARPHAHARCKPTLEPVPCANAALAPLPTDCARAPAPSSPSQDADGKSGSYRNEEQKMFARVGKPDFDSTDLVECVKRLKPTCLIGAVGRAPGCFNQVPV